MLQPVHLMPSTVQVPPGIAPQVPAPLTTLQMAVQQSESLKQMSPTCVQNEICDGLAQVFVVGSQVPLQQSLPIVHALPAVWQPLPSCWHLPLLHALGPLQHAGMPGPHAVPSEVHACAPHMPLVQLRLQQSVACVHAPLVTHLEAVHRLVFASQTPEQHSLPVAQVVPPLRHAPPSPLPPPLPPPPPPLMSPVPACMSGASLLWLLQAANEMTTTPTSQRLRMNTNTSRARFGYVLRHLAGLPSCANSSANAASRGSLPQGGGAAARIGGLSTCRRERR